MFSFLLFLYTQSLWKRFNKTIGNTSKQKAKNLSQLTILQGTDTAVPTFSLSDIFYKIHTWPKTVAGVWPFIPLTILQELHKRTYPVTASIIHAPSHTQRHSRLNHSSSINLHFIIPLYITGSNKHQNMSFHKYGGKENSIFFPPPVSKTCLSSTTRCRHRLCHVLEIILLSRLSGFLCFETALRGNKLYILIMNCTPMSSITYY